MARVKKLLFVDSNIFLDFYRSRNDAGLRLLHHVEAIAPRLISTYQVEMEVKKNRQGAILDGLKDLKNPENIQRPGMFLDAKANRALNKSLRDAEKRIKTMRSRLVKALSDPAAHDPVYQVYQRLFHKDDGLVLKRDNPLRRQIRRLAFRRFIHGCPPRKANDTSIGDAINWEWMIHCAIQHTAELVIVSRDTDYGVTHENVAFINDHLRHEFGERVSNRRSLSLYRKLSDALKHFSVTVSEAEEKEEERVASLPPAIHAAQGTSSAQLPHLSGQATGGLRWDQIVDVLTRDGFAGPDQ
jgi:hypothetical protein